MVMFYSLTSLTPITKFRSKVIYYTIAEQVLPGQTEGLLVVGLLDRSTSS